MVFVTAAEEMPLKAKSIDNIIASFLTEDICFGMHFHWYFLLRAREAWSSFSPPCKNIDIIGNGQSMT